MSHLENLERTRDSGDLDYDDNKEIMELIESRLELGKRSYGHGVRVNENTEQYGVPSNNWEEMALEEILDGMIYMTAQILRLRRRKSQHNKSIQSQT